MPEGDSYVYPDVSVVCGQLEFVGNGTDVIANPAAIVQLDLVDHSEPRRVDFTVAPQGAALERVEATAP